MARSVALCFDQNCRTPDPFPEISCFAYNGVHCLFSYKGLSHMQMKTMHAEEFRTLMEHALVLAEDRHGIKVLQTPDKGIVKLYRLKRRFSSALLYPYALRFLRNTELLKELGIATVTVESVYNIPDIERQAVIYSRLPGSALREVLLETAQQERRAALLERFAAFVAQLHEKGILFRSIHFGNVLVQPSGEFALIDVADLRHHRFGKLWLWQRARNFKHMCRYPQDMEMLAEFGLDRFVEIYARHANLNILTVWILKKTMDRLYKKVPPSSR